LPHDGQAAVVLIGEGLWRRRFGASREILGRSILLDDKPHVVLGVMPEGFDRPVSTLFKKGDFWLPMTVTPRMELRGTRFLRVVGRTAGDPESSRAELSGIAQQLASRFSENTGWEVSVIPLETELVQNVRPVLQAEVHSLHPVLRFGDDNVWGTATRKQ